MSQIGLPKFLQPIACGIADALPLLVDPRLKLDPRLTAEINARVRPLTTVATIFGISAVDAPLMAEIVRPAQGPAHIWVRAADGDEIERFLCADLDNLDAAPVRLPRPAHVEIDWQETASAAPSREPAVELWHGEVLLTSGRGSSGPFYTHPFAARAWAFSRAIDLTQGGVFSAKIVRSICAAIHAPTLLARDAEQVTRLHQFWRCPFIRTIVSTVALPGNPVEDNQSEVGERMAFAHDDAARWIG